LVILFVLILTRTGRGWSGSYKGAWYLHHETYEDILFCRNSRCRHPGGEDSATIESPTRNFRARFGEVVSGQEPSLADERAKISRAHFDSALASISSLILAFESSPLSVPHEQRFP